MKGKSKGTRWINGREYLLCGRYGDPAPAQESAQRYRKEGYLVRVIRIWDYDYMVYRHGPVEGKAK